MGFKHPESLVEFAGEFGEEVGGAGVLEFCGFVDGGAGIVGAAGEAVAEGLGVGEVGFLIVRKLGDAGSGGGLPDRALGDAAEGGEALGDVVDVLFDGSGEFIEEFVKRIEERPPDVPVRLFALRAEVAQVGERLIEDGGDFDAGFERQAVLCGQHRFHVMGLDRLWVWD